MLQSRKADHIRISLEEEVASGLTTGLENYRLIHQALPEIDLDDVSLDQVLFGKTLHAPILISSMTGGTIEAEKINRVLAEAAQQSGIAMGLGSQRAAIEYPETSFTFQVRKYAPDILLFANIGAIQLNYSYSLDQCKQAVDMIEADGLFLHLNALQEALQPEGNNKFAGLLNKIENICRNINVPVIAKEIGWGISEEAAKKLAEAGVAAIDVAGAGGTSWSQVEMFRIHDNHKARVAASFRDWGIPTAEAILQTQRGAPGILIFASGGIKDGIDIVKCIALGAKLGGMARRFLLPATKSLEETLNTISWIRQEIQIAMFAVGAANISELNHQKIIHIIER